MSSRSTSMRHIRAVDRNGETLDVMLSPTRSKKEARKFFRKTLKFFKEKPKRFYTDKNQAYPKPIKRTPKAKRGIMHITVTPIERSHVPIKRRFHAMTGFMNFNNAYHFTKNFEYIRGYLGGTNVSNREQHFEVWDKIEFLANKKAS